MFEHTDSSQNVLILQDQQPPIRQIIYNVYGYVDLVSQNFIIHNFSVQLDIPSMKNVVHITTCYLLWATIRPQKKSSEPNETLFTRYRITYVSDPFSYRIGVLFVRPCMNPTRSAPTMRYNSAPHQQVVRKWIR